MSNLRSLLLLAAALPSLFAQYSFEKITVPGMRDVSVNGINYRGAIVGWASAPNAQVSFKRHASGALERFPNSFSFNSINNYGQIAGSESFTTQGLHATWGVLWSPNGDYQEIYIGGAIEPYTTAWQADDEGNVAGTYRNENEDTLGYIKRGSAITTVFFPGSRATSTYGLAADGTVVGCYDGDSYLRGPRGNYLALNIPGAVFSCAVGIANAAGKIVGYYTDTANKTHGFVYDYMSDLHAIENAAGNIRTISFQVIDVPGAAGTRVYGINARGMIVGRAYASNGTSFGFVGTPR